MAWGNVDLVRSIYAAWERGDFTSVEWAHPDIEFSIVDGPAPGTWAGVAGMADAWRDFLGVWDEWQVEAVDEYRELDAERVFVPARFSARGKASGVELGQVGGKGAALFHVRDGKVTRLQLYMDRENAL